MPRVKILDVLRGLAVLSMIFFQLWSFWGFPLYETIIWKFWIYLFWFCSGCSLSLMRERPKFYERILKRFLMFTAIGYLLTFVVPFHIVSPWFGEALGSIAFNNLWVALILKIQDFKWKILWMLTFIPLSTVKLGFMFEPFLVILCMLIGVVFVEGLKRVDVRFQPLEYFGRNALFFYVGHYLIFGVVFERLNWKLELWLGAVLSLISIGLLIMLQKFWRRLYGRR